MRGLALILGLPLLEIALFVTIGGRLGLWLTLAIVIGTAALGITILRRRGFAGRDMARQAANPLTLAADNGLLMAAGLLLILPGFFTDTLGLLLLIPPVRRLVRQEIGRRMGLMSVVMATRGAPEDDVVDAEFVDVTPAGTPPERDAPRVPSKWTEH